MTARLSLIQEKTRGHRPRLQLFGAIMKRTIVLVALVAVSALTIVVSAQQQANKVDVQKLKDNLYVLTGGGGNTAVFITTNGVVVVDAKNPGWGTPILNKIKELT